MAAPLPAPIRMPVRPIPTALRLVAAAAAAPVSPPSPIGAPRVASPRQCRGRAHGAVGEHWWAPPSTMRRDGDLDAPPNATWTPLFGQTFGRLIPDSPAPRATTPVVLLPVVSEDGEDDAKPTDDGDEGKEDEEQHGAVAPMAAEKVMTIVRGPSGSGKRALVRAERAAHRRRYGDTASIAVFSCMDRFYEDGKLVRSRETPEEATRATEKQAIAAMSAGAIGHVVVVGAYPMRYDMRPIVTAATTHGYRVAFRSPAHSKVRNIQYCIDHTRTDLDASDMRRVVNCFEGDDVVSLDSVLCSNRPSAAHRLSASASRHPGNK
jgi:hypothetical protein